MSRSESDQIWAIEVLKTHCELRGQEGCGIVTERGFERIAPVISMVLDLQYLRPSGDKWPDPCFLIERTGGIIPATYTVLLALIDRIERQVSP